MSTDQIATPDQHAGLHEAPEQPAIINYWGTDETHKHFLPDGIQFFEFKIMNEGAKTKFQKKTSQDMTIGRDQTAKVRMDPATERHALIEDSVCGWNLYMPKAAGSAEMIPVSFTQANLRNWLQLAPPKVVEELEFAIRKANPWMQADMTVEELDTEIDRLSELRRDAVEREAGESVSATK